MNTFHDLFRQPTRKLGGSFPTDRRRELFPGFVERSPALHLWSPGQPIADRGPRLLIGVATWSGYDLNLLDLIEEEPTGAVRVDVFDIGTCTDFAAIQEYIPGLESPMQTPFVGYWVDGRLVECETGHAGRELINRVCSLPTQEVNTRLKTINTRM